MAKAAKKSGRRPGAWGKNKLGVKNKTSPDEYDMQMTILTGGTALTMSSAKE
ncbi:MAG: hypothetical protein ACTHMM_11710 [Agriterribacter sp.]